MNAACAIFAKVAGLDGRSRDRASLVYSSENLGTDGLFQKQSCLPRRGAEWCPSCAADRRQFPNRPLSSDGRFGCRRTTSGHPLCLWVWRLCGPGFHRLRSTSSHLYSRINRSIHERDTITTALHHDARRRLQIGKGYIDDVPPAVWAYKRGSRRLDSPDGNGADGAPSPTRPGRARVAARQARGTRPGACDSHPTAPGARSRGSAAA